jgi:hypothetical protein
VRHFKAAWDRAQATVMRLFPEHQIYFRTNGKVRFFTVSTRLQVSAASVAVIASLWVVSLLGLYAVRSFQLENREEQLAAREAQYAAMQGRVSALTQDMKSLQGDVAQVAQRIERRHEFLERLFKQELDVNARTAKAEPAIARPQARAAAAKPRSPEHEAALRQYRALEQEQLAFVDGAASAADARYEQIDRLWRRLMLKPSGHRWAVCRRLLRQRRVRRPGAPV